MKPKMACQKWHKQEKLLIFVLFIVIMSSFAIAQEAGTKLDSNFDTQHPENFDWANGDYSTIPWENSNIYNDIKWDNIDYSKIDWSKIKTKNYGSIDWSKVKFDQISNFDNIDFSSSDLNFHQISDDQWHKMPSDAYSKMMKDINAQGNYKFENKGNNFVKVNKDSKRVYLTNSKGETVNSFNFDSVQSSTSVSQEGDNFVFKDGNNEKKISDSSQGDFNLYYNSDGSFAGFKKNGNIFSGEFSNIILSKDNAEIDGKKIQFDDVSSYRGFNGDDIHINENTRGYKFELSDNSLDISYTGGNKEDFISISNFDKLTTNNIITLNSRIGSNNELITNDFKIDGELESPIIVNSNVFQSGCESVGLSNSFSSGVIRTNINALKLTTGTILKVDKDPMFEITSTMDTPSTERNYIGTHKGDYKIFSINIPLYRNNAHYGLYKGGLHDYNLNQDYIINSETRIDSFIDENKESKYYGNGILTCEGNLKINSKVDDNDVSVKGGKFRLIHSNGKLQGYYPQDIVTVSNPKGDNIKTSNPVMFVDEDKFYESSKMSLKTVSDLYDGGPIEMIAQRNNFMFFQTGKIGNGNNYKPNQVTPYRNKENADGNMYVLPLQYFGVLNPKTYDISNEFSQNFFKQFDTKREGGLYTFNPPDNKIKITFSKDLKPPEGSVLNLNGESWTVKKSKKNKMLLVNEDGKTKKVKYEGLSGLNIEAGSKAKYKTDKMTVSNSGVRTKIKDNEKEITTTVDSKVLPKSVVEEFSDGKIESATIDKNGRYHFYKKIGGKVYEGVSFDEAIAMKIARFKSRTSATNIVKKPVQDNNINKPNPDKSNIKKSEYSISPKSSKELEKVGLTNEDFNNFMQMQNNAPYAVEGEDSGIFNTKPKWTSEQKEKLEAIKNEKLISQAVDNNIQQQVAAGVKTNKYEISLQTTKGVYTLATDDLLSDNFDLMENGEKIGTAEIVDGKYKIKPDKGHGRSKTIKAKYIENIVSHVNLNIPPEQNSFKIEKTKIEDLPLSKTASVTKPVEPSKDNSEKGNIPVQTSSVSVSTLDASELGNLKKNLNTNSKLIDNYNVFFERTNHYLKNPEQYKKDFGKDIDFKKLKGVLSYYKNQISSLQEKNIKIKNKINQKSASKEQTLNDNTQVSNKVVKPSDQMVGPVAPVLDSNKEPSNTIDEKRIEAVLNNLANELTLNDKEKEELNKMTDAEKEIIQFRGNIKQDHIKKHKNNGVLTYGDLPVIAEKINSLDISNDEKDKLLEKYASGYKDVVNPITAMDSKDIKQPLIADVLKDQKMIRNTLVFTPITDDLEIDTQPEKEVNNKITNDDTNLNLLIKDSVTVPKTASFAEVTSEEFKNDPKYQYYRDQGYTDENFQDLKNNAKYLVFHTTYSNYYESTRSEFTRKDASTSAHLVVDKDGNIHQFLDPSMPAYAVGKKTSLKNLNINNLNTINVEFVGLHDPTTGDYKPTPAQKEAAIKITKWAMKNYPGIRENGVNAIKYHGEIAYKTPHEGKAEADYVIEGIKNGTISYSENALS